MEEELVKLEEEFADAIAKFDKKNKKKLTTEDTESLPVDFA